MAEQPKVLVDYLIVGYGSAGSVLAAALSQKYSVVVLEAGPDNSKNEVILTPLKSGLLYDNPALPVPSPSNLGYRSDPQLNSTTYALPRGTGAGGSSNHHGMLDGFGSRGYYRQLERLAGSHWSWSNFERVYDKQTWLGIRQAKLQGEFSDALITAAEKQGIKDIYLADTQVDKSGLRSFAAKDIPTKATIIYDTLVERILFRQGRAVGVSTLKGSRLMRVDAAHSPAKAKEYKRQCYWAEREVIVCAGAYGSPQLLMLSGIGPLDELKALGIPVIIDNPNVGHHMQDHLEVGLIHKLKGVEWKQEPADTGFDLMLDHDGLHIMSTQFYFRNFDMHAAAKEMDAKAVYHTFIVENMRIGEAAGVVKLQTDDVRDPSLIDPQLWKDEAAVSRCAKGIQLMRKVVANMKEFAMEEVAPGAQYKSQEQLEKYIREYSAFGHHPAGTCAIGKVVDSKLRVLGVKGLRVCDLSVVPLLVDSTPSRFVYGLADLAAELILAAKK